MAKRRRAMLQRGVVIERPSDAASNSASRCFHSDAIVWLPWPRVSFAERDDDGAALAARA